MKKIKTAEELVASTKHSFDRLSEGLKVAGSGNAAGLFGAVAALNTLQKTHTDTEILLKPTAIIFALGVLLFAIAFALLAFAYAYFDIYISSLKNSEEEEQGEISNAATSHWTKCVNFLTASLSFGIGSAFAFFIGFAIAFAALIRY